MTWVRKDDHYPLNRKVARLSDAAYRLDDEAICWSNRELADGIIRAHELTQIRAKATRRLAAELVDAGRWHPAGATCSSPKCPPPGPDGWVIHDYFDYQFTREKVLADRAAKAERQRNWLAARKKGSGAVSGTASGTASDAPTDIASDAATDHTSERVSGTHPAPTPVPAPAPKGKREGDLPEAPAARHGAAERADDGRADQPAVPSQPPPNGTPPPELRETLQRLAARSRSPDRVDALAKLRELTPDVPVPTEATEPAEQPS